MRTWPRSITSVKNIWQNSANTTAAQAPLRRMPVLLFVRLNFSGFFQSFCGCLYDGQFSFIQRIKKRIYPLSAFTFFTVPSWKEKAIYGNIQQSDYMVKGIQTGVLAPCFQIHDRMRGSVNELGKIFLRPAHTFPFSFDFLSKRPEVEPGLLVVHFYITLHHSTL